jgi:hypothetical protein
MCGWELIVDNISFAAHVFETAVKQAARSASANVGREYTLG